MPINPSTANLVARTFARAAVAAGVGAKLGQVHKEQNAGPTRIPQTFKTSPQKISTPLSDRKVAHFDAQKESTPLRLATEGLKAAEGQKAQVRNVLDAAIKNPDAKILVMSYSPTGGGHTERSMNPMRLAVEKGDIKPGDVVVLQVPLNMDAPADRPKNVWKFVAQLQQKNIDVVLLESDKAIQGHLFGDKAPKPTLAGASDKVKILKTFAENPTRPQAETKTVLDGTIPAPDEKGHYSKEKAWPLKSISAKNLLSSIANRVKSEHKGVIPDGKIKVFSDMAPDLQKAANEAGVKGADRVDLQNHGIVMTMKDSPQETLEANAVPRQALFSKALGGYGEKVSHVALGAKNTLQAVLPQMAVLGLSRDTPVAAAKDAFVELCLEYGVRLEGPPPGTKWAGIVASPNAKSAEDIDNVVVLYIREYAPHVKGLIDAGMSDEAHMRELIDSGMKDEVHSKKFEKTLFVFAGASLAMPQESGGLVNDVKPDMLKLAYLSQSDTILTGGAGTTGEFAYLNVAGRSEASILMLPQEGQDEQNANADWLERQVASDVKAENEGRTDDVKGFSGHVAVNRAASEMTLEEFAGHVGDFLEKSENKYAEGKTVASVVDAISDPETYDDHTVELLFGDNVENEPGSEAQQLEVLERELQSSDALTATKRFVKVTHQAWEQIDESLKDSGELPENITIQMKQKSEPTTVSLKMFAEKMSQGEVSQWFDMDSEMSTSDVAKLPGVESSKELYQTIVDVLDQRANEVPEQQLRTQFETVQRAQVKEIDSGF